MARARNARTPAFLRSRKATTPREEEPRPTRPFLQPPPQWLTKQTAKSHTLKEIVTQFKCTEQGAKSAMSRRGITECLDWVHEGNAWKAKTKSATKAPKEHEVEAVVGKRVFESGAVQYKIKWKEFDDEHATWEPTTHLQHAQQAVAEYEDAHHECA